MRVYKQKNRETRTLTINIEDRNGGQMELLIYNETIEKMRPKLEVPFCEISTVGLNAEL